jgi:hypothetical protein
MVVMGAAAVAGGDGCKKDSGSTKLAGSGSAGEPTWAECYANVPKKKHTLADPHGQGRVIVGFGIPLPPDVGRLPDPRFLRFDRFDPRSVKTRDGLEVVDFRIENNALEGYVTRNGSKQEVTDWDGATFRGKLRCPNPNLHGAEKHVVVHVTTVAEQNAADVGSSASTPVTVKTPVYTFELQQQDGDPTLAPPSLCRGGDDVAFPFPGYWDPSSKLVLDPDQFSFVCVKRDAAKCLRLGYSVVEHEDLFEACTRMMTADYCGNGKSFTKEKTEVQVWDVPDHVAQATPNDEVVFEAVWDANGAVCMARTRWPGELFDPAGMDDCLRDASRTCTDEADAVAKHPNKKLVVNHSCKAHPCGIEKDPLLAPR